MKEQTTNTSRLGVAFSICLGVLWAMMATAHSQSVGEKHAIKVFEGEVKEYIKLRNGVREKIPKLSKDATPEQIHLFTTTFENATRTARAGAKIGEIFKPEVSTYIRTTLKTHFRGSDRVELRKTIFEAENETIPLRINYPYPASKEFTEMPATLLLKLPQLTKELRYRFVGRNLILVDRENNLIVDYMANALP
jgi:hypothetical protein